ncbi:acyl-CoA synthetase [Methylobacterium currus]|uniref:Acyl-CoA synthetase n=1 Tax=Methylobacterium currus TaxID=2051553 RepID=A0A2R4WUR5_9HYPH|nr:acyl-CoA synthetase [Methylobacterium currus]AWB25282.1 acyl-CoA synthetase [Methylobacterium currus]UHC19581.1 acyl-CoA synthetase [Methylobacterium currus]
MKHPSHFARVTPDKVAYRMARSGETMTYAELDARSNRNAHALRALGVGQGGNVALLFENRLDFLALAWACQRSGIFYTAINTHLAAAEIAYIVGDCDATVAIVSDTFAACLDDLAAACPTARFFVCGGASPPERDWKALAAGQPATPVADEAAGADLLYSSGTTGRPKGIVRRFEPRPIDTVIPALMSSLCETIGGMGPDTVLISPAPLYHAAPLRFAMMTAMLGGTALVTEKFDAEEVLQQIETWGVTHGQFVPTHFVRMLKLPEATRARYRHDTLRVVYHAAAPCPRDVKAAMIEWWGPILVEYYASSEANGVTLATSQEWQRFPGTVGRSLTGPIVIADEAGQELPPGEIGAVYFDSGVQFEYRNDPEKTAAAYLRPGCATFGDIGHVNEEGFLFLADRKAYMIISGGVNIYPQETEDLLVSHPAIEDVAVFGVPNEEMGEEVKAVVQLRAGIDGTPETAREIIAWCRARLSHYKVPRSIDFRSELPRTPTGKLLKRLLRDEYWAGRR